MTLRLIAAAAAALLMMAPTTGVAATSCYDLWYVRNAIFDAKGYCFKTALGKQVFDNSDCTTSSPKFTKKELAAIEAIRAEEKKRGCKVN